ncbi:MAG: DUF5103 domain-containing protein [Bacteroidales bacterium]|nr:DUF5103 domain-containing protein [Bacteroidales bacterium]
MKYLYITLLSVFSVFYGKAQIDFSNISMENKIYNEDILSAKIEKTDISFALPVIQLGAQNALTLRFDDKSDAPKYYHYTLIHCTYDWQPTSNLQRNEYLGSFEDMDISDYQTSINTRQFYISYSITFPNENIYPTKSGNYIIYVYDDDENPVLTYRFYVVENLVDVSAAVKETDNISLRLTHQQLQVNINTANFKVLNPGRFLKVKTCQNNREDNAVVVSTPHRVSGNSLIFDQSDQILFEGGAEFNTFNIRTLKTRMEHVEKHIVVAGINYTWLYADKTRAFLPYLDDNDINGCYFVTSDDASDSLYGADYTEVHFFLDAPNLPSDVDIFVYGELSNWNLDKSNKMVYNSHRHMLEAILYLKTGYYNYTYIAQQKNTDKGTFMYTEGNHWETGNRYNTFVYYQGDNLDYDRIIGYCEVISDRTIRK